MATNAGTIFVELQARVGKFRKDLLSAQKGLSGFASKTANFVRQNKLAITAAATAVGIFAFKAVKAASDLEETQAKFNTVFRTVTKEAEKSSAILQKSFLLSERAAKENLAAIQDTLVPMGLMRDEAQNISFEVVKLAADLGSFNNLPTEQVMRDIQSALVGNFETMKKYGVVLKATDVQNRILNKGLATSAGAITNAQRVTEAYKLILEGTEDAQGDVARTSSSYANQVKQLKSNVEDLLAVIGKELIPVFKEWVSWGNAIIKMTGKQFKSTKEGLTVTEIALIQQKKEIELTKEKLRLLGNSVGAISSEADQLRQSIITRTRLINQLKKEISSFDELATGAKKASDDIIKSDEKQEENARRISGVRIKRAIKENQERIERERETLEQLKEVAEKDAEEKLERQMEWKNVFITSSEDMHNVAQSLASQTFEQFGQGIADMIFEGRKFSDIMKSIWRDLARAVIAEIAKMIAKFLILLALKRALSMFGPIGVAAGEAVGAVGAASAGAAEGGLIREPSLVTGLRSGKTILAGEAGAEAIVPLGGNGESNITARELGTSFAGGGGGSVPMNVTINISGQFIEGNETQWQKLMRNVLVPEMRRYTMSNPVGPMIRRRGASV